MCSKCVIICFQMKAMLLVLLFCMRIHKNINSLLIFLFIFVDHIPMWFLFEVRHLNFFAFPFSIETLNTVFPFSSLFYAISMFRIFEFFRLFDYYFVRIFVFFFCFIPYAHSSVSMKNLIVSSVWICWKHMWDEKRGKQK